jgi:CBS domain-containing protein
MSYQNTMEKMFSETLVTEVMTKALVAVSPSTTLFQISKMMEQGGMGSILVKNNGIPSGIITDRDFAIKVSAKGIALDTPVEKIATFPLITIKFDDSLLEAAKLMSEKKIRKLAVIDGSKVIGIITSTDLVNKLASQI